MTEQLALFRAGEGEGKEGFSVRKFVESFEVLAEAEGGIAAARGLILDLAVRGRLVAHAPRVAATQEPGPYRVPHGWVWTSLGGAVVKELVAR